MVKQRTTLGTFVAKYELEIGVDLCIYCRRVFLWTKHLLLTYHENWIVPNSSKCTGTFRNLAVIQNFLFNVLFIPRAFLLIRSFCLVLKILLFYRVLSSQLSSSRDQDLISSSISVAIQRSRSLLNVLPVFLISAGRGRQATKNQSLEQCTDRY